MNLNNCLDIISYQETYPYRVLLFSIIKIDFYNLTSVNKSINSISLVFIKWKPLIIVIWKSF